MGWVSSLLCVLNTDSCLNIPLRLDERLSPGCSVQLSYQFVRENTFSLIFCLTFVSPNLRHHTTVLNLDVLNCYMTLKVVCNKLSNNLINTQ